MTNESQMRVPAAAEPAPSHTEFQPIIIRYEGLQAANHEIELQQLGESLQGFAKTIAVAAHLAHTGSAALHYDAMQVKVVAVPVHEHHCFEFWAVIKPIIESKEFFTGAAAAVLTPVLAYIFSRRTSEEMKHLSDALKQSIGGNQAVTEKLVSTVEKLAEALSPSVRKALTPIDRSCTEIDIFQGRERIQSMDAETKKAFATSGSKVADHSATFTGVVTEFNITNGACQVQLENEPRPTPGRVLDPAFSEPNNPYATALATQQPISFLAKYEIDDAGNLLRLHIFDTTDL